MPTSSSSSASLSHQVILPFVCTLPLSQVQAWLQKEGNTTATYAAAKVGLLETAIEGSLPNNGPNPGTLRLLRWAIVAINVSTQQACIEGVYS
jgi:hypothetical protein